MFFVRAIWIAGSIRWKRMYSFVVGLRVSDASLSVTNGSISLCKFCISFSCFDSFSP